MAGAIGNVILIIVALIVISAVGMLALSLLGTLMGLIGLAVKLAIIGGLIYFAWVLVRKLVRTA
jgi:hypothetical protein